MKTRSGSLATPDLAALWMMDDIMLTSPLFSSFTLRRCWPSPQFFCTLWMWFQETSLCYPPCLWRAAAGSLSGQGPGGLSWSLTMVRRCTLETCCRNWSESRAPGCTWRIGSAVWRPGWVRGGAPIPGSCEIKGPNDSASAPSLGTPLFGKGYSTSDWEKHNLRTSEGACTVWCIHRDSVTLPWNHF